MDPLSMILLALVLLWVVFALRHVISNKGGCSCGGNKQKKHKCSGGCNGCSGCHK